VLVVGGGDRVVFLASLNPPLSHTTITGLSRNTNTLSRPSALVPKLLLTPKRTSVYLDMLASREAPEEKGDGEQENG